MLKNDALAEENTHLRERFGGWLRLFLLLAMLAGYCMLSIKLFEEVNFAESIAALQDHFPILNLIPPFLISLLVPFTRWVYFRHTLALLGVLTPVFAGATHFIRELYKLPRYIDAYRYLLASMFGLFYPRLVIDGSSGKNAEGEVHTLVKIGGPGWLVVQPGCVAVTKAGATPANVRFAGRHFLSRFERVITFADMDEQIGQIGEIRATTHDGIRLVVRNIHYGFKLIPVRGQGGQPVIRDENNPYPFSTDAVLDMTFNAAVGESGPGSWQDRVQIFVTVAIRNFIAEKDIDFLTAPRVPNQTPRPDLRNQLFSDGVRRNLQNIGAELLWIDTGHLDIVELPDVKQENVDSQRLAFWESRWKGKANANLASAEGLREAYEAQGRAEGQAEMLKSITTALQDIPLKGQPQDRIRRILLTRTAQILEGWRESQKHNPGEKS